MDHLHVSVESMFVDSVVLALTTLEHTLLQMHGGVMSLKSKLIGGLIITDGASMCNLSVLLMTVRHVPLEGAFVHSLIITDFAYIRYLRILFVNFAFVPFKCRRMTSPVFASGTLIELHLVMDGLDMAVQGVFVESFIVT